MPKRLRNANDQPYFTGGTISALHQFCRQLRHRCVRDLAFSLYSESLLQRIHHCPATPYTLEFDAHARAWLRQLDQQPAALVAHLAQRRSTRLGLYFESLWSFYWQHSDRGRLLSQGQQLTRKGKTLGALDFVVVTEQEQLLHIEAAVKFYLAHTKTPEHDQKITPPGSLWHSAQFDWIGPNGNDRLAWKLDHMRRHQLPLSASAESRSAVALAYGRAAPISQRFLLRGCLFWPAAMACSSGTGSSVTAPPANLTDDINPRVNSGRWWYLSDFLTLDALAGCEHFTIFPRNYWLAPACYPGALAPLPLAVLQQALTQQIARREKGIMVVALNFDDGRWHEAQRFFVVPDQWPATARPSRNT